MSICSCIGYSCHFVFGVCFVRYTFESVFLCLVLFNVGSSLCTLSSVIRIPIDSDDLTHLSFYLMSFEYVLLEMHELYVSFGLNPTFLMIV